MPARALSHEHFTRGIRIRGDNGCTRVCLNGFYSMWTCLPACEAAQDPTTAQELWVKPRLGEKTTALTCVARSVNGFELRIEGLKIRAGAVGEESGGTLLSLPSIPPPSAGKSPVLVCFADWKMQAASYTSRLHMYTHTHTHTCMYI